MPYDVVATFVKDEASSHKPNDLKLEFTSFSATYLTTNRPNTHKKYIKNSKKYINIFIVMME